MWCCNAVCVVGSRFQAARNKNEKEDVVSEYEDEVDCCGDCCCLGPHLIFVYLRWFQVCSKINCLGMLLDGVICCI